MEFLTDWHYWLLIVSCVVLGWFIAEAWKRGR